MILTLIISAIILVSVITLFRVFRKPIRRWVNTLYMKFKITTLRTAIRDADGIKDKTGRKAMVVFNKDTDAFEPIEKKLLKRAANASKRKNNAPMTEGRKRAAVKAQQEKKQNSLKKDRVFTPEKNHRTEKKSLYVTK